MGAWSCERDVYGPADNLDSVLVADAGVEQGVAHGDARIPCHVFCEKHR